ncbi:golgin subfamily A member 6-like protein 6 [Anguilla rostrata]|uniref:golgin subfamily A member 6-like protein 6 n=1 Tax=Anguilla anguilla TaxID=7936 RepID=UPI0015A9E0EA|nr:golgin subfamily A member 6-like protein 6 [Anguilla anguilla]
MATLKATSHGDLQSWSLGKTPALDGGLSKSFSLSSGSNATGRFPHSKDGEEDIQELSRVSRPYGRRPIRAVRPVSALSPSASFLQINRLQGELVRKRKECEDLRQQNKYLSNEIHMERIMMRTESELTMRNLRNLNQELQAQVKELKQKLHQSQQRATLCSRAAEEADASRGEAEKGRALAEARAINSRQEREQVLEDKARMSEDFLQLKNRHADVQSLLARTEKNYFETKIKLDRALSERQVLLEENHSFEKERNDLRKNVKQLTEENSKLKEREASARHRAEDAEQQAAKANEAQREAERERRLAEAERQDSATECQSWKQKHQALADIFRAQEDLKAQRQNKASQANIKSYFLCMTESDQRVKILKNQDGSPRNFTEGDPVYISTPDSGSEDAGRGTERTMYRVVAPSTRKGTGSAHFSELSPIAAEPPDITPPRRNKKVVEYFWLPTDDE